MKICVLFLGLSLVGVAGCGSSRHVQRVGADTQTDLSGDWNDTDARMTSEALIKQCFEAAWLGNFVNESGRQPNVGVARIVNKSDEHIDAGVFVKNIERAMVNSGKVSVVAAEGHEMEAVQGAVQEGASGMVSEDSAPSVGQWAGKDFVMVGRVTSIVDQVQGQRTKFYKITFELINTTTRKKVWIGDHEIKKVVTQARARW